jgi:hypothetical protein
MCSDLQHCPVLSDDGSAVGLRGERRTGCGDGDEISISESACDLLVFGSLPQQASLRQHYVPCTILIGILRSISRACNSDSESLSLALTQ